MTKIEWVRGPDGSEGMSWNALRAVRTINRGGNIKTVSANHCEPANEACRFCYAGRMNARLGGLPFKPGHRKDYTFIVDPEKLRAPLRKKKPTRIFIESMSDAFGEWWPTEYIDQLYAVMALTPQHTYINLSKRPERRRQYLNDEGASFRVATAALTVGRHLPDNYPGWSRDRWKPSVIRGCTQPAYWPLPNVIEGTSVSCQSEADEFVPILLETKAALRCLSCEPLLGPIDLTRIRHQLVGESFMVGNALYAADSLNKGREQTRLDWVIVGGESGPKARPMHPQWARDLRDQCQAAGVAYFFKQWGEYRPCRAPVLEWSEPDGLKGVTITVMPNEGTAPLSTSHDEHLRRVILAKESTAMARVGKKAAGRLLDGRTWDEFPTVKTKIGEAA